jgi:hypothetical protein
LTIQCTTANIKIMVDNHMFTISRKEEMYGV